MPSNSSYSHYLYIQKYLILTTESSVAELGQGKTNTSYYTSFSSSWLMVNFLCLQAMSMDQKNYTNLYTLILFVFSHYTI